MSTALKDRLQDAGCTEEMILLYEKTPASGKLNLLKRFRCTLLENMHDSQRKLDRMDDLIHELQTERKGKL